MRCVSTLSPLSGVNQTILKMIELIAIAEAAEAEDASQGRKTASGMQTVIGLVCEM